jgi:hypothetical protein
VNRRKFVRAAPLSASLLTLPWKGRFSGAFPENQEDAQFTNFNFQAFAARPVEKSYAFHKALSEGGWQVRRDPQAKPTSGEIAIPENGWVALVKSIGFG